MLNYNIDAPLSRGRAFELRASSANRVESSSTAVCVESSSTAARFIVGVVRSPERQPGIPIMLHPHCTSRGLQFYAVELAVVHRVGADGPEFGLGVYSSFTRVYCQCLICEEWYT